MTGHRQQHPTALAMASTGTMTRPTGTQLRCGRTGSPSRHAAACLGFYQRLRRTPCRLES
jgi:hypothetical protein